MTQRELFAAAVAEMKQELSRLQEKLRDADTRGDSRTALTVLARMLHLQATFLSKWPTRGEQEESAVPKGSEGIGAGSS